MDSFISYKLKPEELEQCFRAENYIKDRNQTIFVLLAVIAIVSGFFILDFYFLKNTTSLYTTLLSRFITLLSFVSGVIFLYRSKTQLFDIIIFVLAIILTTQMMIVNYIRPSDYITLVAWDIFVLFSIYIAIPFKLCFQILSAMFHTIGTSILWLILKDTSWDTVETYTILAAYFSSNIFGVFVSLQLKRYRRQQYLLLLKERETRIKLEKAQEEVKILKGVLPICSFCKKIRDEKGDWNQLESYISKSSEADFSHSICPECARIHYPEFDLHKE